MGFGPALPRTDAAALRRLKRAGDPLTIWWATDTHVSVLDDLPDDPGAISSSLHLYSGTAKMRRFRDEARLATPDVVLHTGDCVHFTAPELPMFTSAWNDIPGPKGVMIGNHDLYADSYEDVVTAFGREAESEVAGSKFNTAFSVTHGDVAARIIMVDTQVTTSGHTGGLYEGELQTDAIDWLTTELEECSEDIALICSHHGPHEWTNDESSSFVPEHASAVASAVDGVIATRPGLKVRWFYGHEHGTQVVVRKTNLSENLPGYLSPAMIDANPGTYLAAYLFTDGSLRFARRRVKYPY